MPLSSQQTADVQKQYDPMRKRAQQQEAANLQGQNDAMARRAAMQGGGPGGAYEKQAQVVQGQSAERLQAANEGINAQEQGALNQAREIQGQRDFQREERVGSQDWQAGQAGEQRKFITSERLGSQKYSTGERLGSQDFAAGQSKLSRDQQQSQFQAQLDRDWQKFMHETDVDNFNMDMANKMFNKKDMLEQLFSNFSAKNIGGKNLGMGEDPLGRAGGWWGDNGSGGIASKASGGIL